MSFIRSIALVFCLFTASVALSQETKITPWAEAFQPPAELATERVILKPLSPQYAQLDHQALMSSRASLMTQGR